MVIITIYDKIARSDTLDFKNILTISPRMIRTPKERFNKFPI
jgi:hypothetical protein